MRSGIALLAILLLFQTLLPDFDMLLLLGLLAVAMLTVRPLGAAVALTFVLSILFLREGFSFGRLNGPWSIPVATVVLGTVMLVARARTSVLMISRIPLRELLNRLLGPPAEARQAVVSSLAASFSSLLWGTVRQLALAAGCVVVSRMLLGLLPDRRNLHSSLVAVRDMDPALRSAALAVACVVAAWLVVSEVSWRLLTSDQARLYLRSELLRSMLPDMSLIVRRHIAARQRRVVAAARKRKSAAPGTTGSTEPG
jgi:hypothetical protein